MTYNQLKLETNSGVATITLNRPEKRNALSYDLIEELLGAFAEVENSEARVLILTGAGTAFCSGMDLEALKGLIGRASKENLQDSETIARLFRTLYDFPKPTIAAVNGPAMGGGVGLATLCDFTLAVPEAKFGYTEVRIGFVPAIVSVFLIRQIGEKLARDLMLTGRLFDASEAQRMGLVNEVVPADKLTTHAQEQAAQLLENSPASLRATKRLLSGYAKEEIDAQIKTAVSENAAIRTTEDFREGITAFLEEAETALERKMSEENTNIAICETRLRVRYAETDQMGVVYHANYFVWFEVGRVELLRQLGFSYRDMEKDDQCFIAVVDARCRFKAPARYDDEVAVRTFLKNIRSSVVHFGYEVIRLADNVVLAEGETTHVVTNAQMKATALPEKYMEAFRQALGK